MDGRTDKNRQTIAVTLRLRFAARVNDGSTSCLIEHVKYSKSDALLIAQKRTVYMHAERRTILLYSIY